MSASQAGPDQSSATRAAPPPGAAARPQSAQRPAAPATGQRRVRLSASRVDPWSALKLSFLLSIALGIAIVVAAGVLWTVLDSIGVFTSVNGLLADITGTDAIDVNQYVGLSQVLSAATVLAVVDVILLTALATVGSLLYNASSALVGGLRLTLTDD